MKGGEQNSVRIEAILPDMRPVAPAPKDHTGVKVIIILENGCATADHLVCLKQDYEHIAPYLEDTGFGIGKLSKRYFDDREAGKVGGFFFYRDVANYITQKADGRYIKIACLSAPPVCHVKTDFDEYVSGRYSMGPNQIPERWKELDGKVVALVRSFRQPPEQKQEETP